VGFAADAANRLDRLADFEGSEGWLFPAAERTKADRQHAEAGLFNDYFSAMPGVSFSPHAIRYAMATYGERDLGFRPGEAAVILDHMEGVEPSDVTGSFYSSNPQIARKREMMGAWTGWCDKWAERATAVDPLLLDREYMLEMIYRNRYGDQRLIRRMARQQKLGVSLSETAARAALSESDEKNLASNELR